MAGGAGWSKNGIGKSRRSRSRASTPSRFFRCWKIHFAGFSEKRPSRVLPIMTEMTVMLLLLTVSRKKKGSRPNQRLTLNVYGDNDQRLPALHDRRRNLLRDKIGREEEGLLGLYSHRKEVYTRLWNSRRLAPAPRSAARRARSPPPMMRLWRPRGCASPSSPSCASSLALALCPSRAWPRRPRWTAPRWAATSIRWSAAAWFGSRLGTSTSASASLSHGRGRGRDRGGTAALARGSGA